MLTIESPVAQWLERPTRYGGSWVRIPSGTRIFFRVSSRCKNFMLYFYYQVVSAIPKRLWSLAKCSDTINKSFFTRNDNIFSLNESTQINLYKARSRDFYNLLNVKIHTEDQTGPKRWSEKLSLKKDVWTKIFKSLKNICKETKLKELFKRYLNH